MSENMNPIEKLFDEDNTENIVLVGNDGKAVEFEQVALISLEDKDYAILALANPPEGAGDDEGIVFEIREDENGSVELATVTDDSVIDAVFDVYDRLWEEQGNK
jgi:uncharacterized protein YrzB (UPF0473 family)